MTKKHYEAIAGIIKDLHSMNDELHETGRGYRKDALKAVSSELATYFATDNKNFDRTRFLQACGVGCSHDWDNYGKCCDCGKWKHQI